MKTFILSILIGSLTAAAATAQQSNREVYPRQAGIEHNAAVKSFSSDFVTGIQGQSQLLSLQHLLNGFDNMASVNVYGSENTTFLLQEGYNIAGIMAVAGDDNKASLRQSGSDLLSILGIKGNSNQFDFTQLGSGLRNYFYIKGSGLDFDALQTNAGMRLTQTNPGGLPLTIQQSGRPTPIIISNNQ